MNVSTVVLELDESYILSKSVPVLSKCGIYFLIHSEKIVYVGKSVNVDRRIREHQLDGKNFERYFSVECNENDLVELEKFYINRFDPILNVVKPKNKFHPRKKIHTPTGENFRPQLGEPLKRLCAQTLKKTNKNNLSKNWNETDAARYLMAKGWDAVSGQPIPKDVKDILKPFYLDLDL